MCEENGLSSVDLNNAVAKSYPQETTNQESGYTSDKTITYQTNVAYAVAKLIANWEQSFEILVREKLRLSKKISDLEEVLSHWKKNCEDLSYRILELEGQNKKYQMQLENWKTNVESLEEEIETLNFSYDTDTEHLKAKIKDLENEIAYLQR